MDTLNNLPFSMGLAMDNTASLTIEETWEHVGDNIPRDQAYFINNAISTYLPMVIFTQTIQKGSNNNELKEQLQFFVEREEKFLSTLDYTPYPLRLREEEEKWEAIYLGGPLNKIIVSDYKEIVEFVVKTHNAYQVLLQSLKNYLTEVTTPEIKWDLDYSVEDVIAFLKKQYEEECDNVIWGFEHEMMYLSTRGGIEDYDKRPLKPSKDELETLKKITEIESLANFLLQSVSDDVELISKYSSWEAEHRGSPYSSMGVTSCGKVLANYDFKLESEENFNWVRAASQYSEKLYPAAEFFNKLHYHEITIEYLHQGGPEEIFDVGIEEEFTVTLQDISTDEDIERKILRLTVLIEGEDMQEVILDRSNENEMLFFENGSFRKVNYAKVFPSHRDTEKKIQHYDYKFINLQEA